MNSQQPRAGAVLMEVLVSMIILGIGGISVLSLFPIAVQRSVRATQLTAATQMRYAAEARIDIDPRIVHDPDGDSDVAEHESRAYVIDPLGAQRVSGVAGTFGTGPSPGIERFDLGMTAQQAVDMVTSPDDWSEIASFEVDDVNGLGLTGALDLSEFSNVPNVRAVLYDENLNSIIRPIDQLGNVLSGLTGLLLGNPPPPDFTPARVSIQAHQMRYSWMLTVRKSAGGAASVSVVVFFKRPFDAASERLHDGMLLGTQQFVVSQSDLAGRAQQGGWCFDPDNARWYAIEATESLPGGRLGVKLDRPVPAGDTLTRLMFPENVVDVFPLKTKT